MSEARPRIAVAWSSGKDSAWALHRLRQAGEFEVATLLSSLNRATGRMQMHATPEALLDAQADALGLTVLKVWLPDPCPNTAYEQAMAEANQALLAQGVTHIAFGDLFLQDIRDYREKNLAGTGLTPVFPLWEEPTRALAEEIIAGGVQAILTCIDTEQLDASFAGRLFDATLLRDLPVTVDPCGERGEFHTFVTQAPGFARPISVQTSAPIAEGRFARVDVG